MDNTNLTDWLYFANVVDAQGFSAAANKLGLSPSVISKRISQLEKKLGVRLLQRSTRSFVLTEPGKVFYQHCQRIKTEIETAKAAVLHTQKKTAGLLRIHAPMGFGQLHLAPAIYDFILVNPDIQVELHLGQHLPNLIDAGLDLAIFIKEPPDSSYVAKRIATRGVGIYGSPAYFAKRGVPSTPQDLLHHNCLLYQKNAAKPAWQFLDGRKNIMTVNVDGNFKANSSRVLIKAAVAGLGIAKLPSFMVTEEIRSGILISVLEKYCQQAIGIYAVYPHREYLSARTRLLINFLTNRFSSAAY